MSYHYQSYSHTSTTTRNSNGETHTRSTTRTTTSTPETGTTSSVIVREISESELENLSLESTQNYEITDDDRLTKYDFYSLMNTEDEESESESESDVEYHWFPSLLHKSIIEFLDDSEQEQYMDDDSNDAIVQVEENEDFDEEDEEDESMSHGYNGKRYYKRHSKKHSKRPRKSEQVPVDVIHIIL